MQTDEQLKAMVRQRYSGVAEQSKLENETSCCGSCGCPTDVYNIMTDDYSDLPGYNPDADLGLGCGLPTVFAAIKEGDTVIDLGSGAGNDCFVARSQTGDQGHVIGVDFTPAMIRQATLNANKLGYANVEFRLGDIEHIPIANETADVVVSNCVLNLVPNKQAVFNEIFRVLKSNGHFSISDIVIIGDLPHAIKEDAEMYAGCVAGAIKKDEYLKHIHEAGFQNILIQKEKPIVLPDEILSKYLNVEEIHSFRNGLTGIFSITVYAEKPDATCCGKTNCCH